MTNDEALRARALQALAKKRAFTGHLLIYLVVNSILVAIRATVAGGGFFWPMFPMLGWGIGVLLQGWNIYRGEPTEEEIQKEMQRLR